MALLHVPCFDLPMHGLQQLAFHIKCGQVTQRERFRLHCPRHSQYRHCFALHVDYGCAWSVPIAYFRNRVICMYTIQSDFNGNHVSVFLLDMV